MSQNDQKPSRALRPLVNGYQTCCKYVGSIMAIASEQLPRIPACRAPYSSCSGS